MSEADQRRVLTIAISADWDVSPGESHERIWNALQCAINMWNNTTDQYHNRTGYFWKVDQTNQHGTPDVTIMKSSCPGGAYGCLIYPDGTTDTPSNMILSRWNTEGTMVRDEDVCGRIAHEMIHKMGGNYMGNCGGATILNHSRRNGTRHHNTVEAADINLVNEALNNPGGCQGTWPATEIMTDEGSHPEDAADSYDETQRDIELDDGEGQWWCDYHYRVTLYFRWNGSGYEHWYTTYDLQYVDNCEYLLSGN